MFEHCRFLNLVPESGQVKHDVESLHEAHPSGQSTQEPVLQFKNKNKFLFFKCIIIECITLTCTSLSILA